MKYDYKKAIKSDILHYAELNPEQIKGFSDGAAIDFIRFSFVVGYDEGTYTHDRKTAEQYASDNLDLIRSAEYYAESEGLPTDCFESEDWEKIDVYIRDRLLIPCLSEVVSENECCLAALEAGFAKNREEFDESHFEFFKNAFDDYSIGLASAKEYMKESEIQALSVEEIKDLGNAITTDMSSPHAWTSLGFILEF